MQVHPRLRRELLEAAAAQFAGRRNGLARAGLAGGTLLLSEECGACGGWRITRFDDAMNPDGHDHHDGEAEASGRCWSRRGESLRRSVDDERRASQAEVKIR